MFVFVLCSYCFTLPFVFVFHLEIHLSLVPMSFLFSATFTSFYFFKINYFQNELCQEMQFSNYLCFFSVKLGRMLDDKEGVTHYGKY